MSNIDPAQLINLLKQGEIVLKGILPWSSNYSFLLEISDETQQILAVYKPRQGERPLWDFPQGTLCYREFAAFLVSDALTWSIVPPTILRQGPHGLGSMQWFVPHDSNQHYFTFEGQFTDQVQKIQLFDVIINNADRKSGHVLLDENDKLWGIDHGISFHTDYKLRSVIWEYAGQAIPSTLLQDLIHLQEQLSTGTPLHQKLMKLLNKKEWKSLQKRTNQLVNNQIFPHPGTGRHYPWPLI